ncbi:hypothetical protein DEO72_LG4g219 [Vigna unguiculata]|uniref:Uncharacterized protein n=1 Tax=Vigna unguiculata TaxID=3917 RepID=A0A4D6LLT6_VIGUN|nr:hypothetical protein DEO72_LG4g219 [Vigna unguiculata]
MAALSVNDDKTAKTDWVTTANGSVQWNLRNPIAVAGATVAGAAVAGAAVVSAAVVSCRDHDAFLSCGRKWS